MENEEYQTAHSITKFIFNYIVKYQFIRSTICHIVQQNKIMLYSKSLDFTKKLPFLNLATAKATY